MNNGDSVVKYILLCTVPGFMRCNYPQAQRSMCLWKYILHQWGLRAVSFDPHLGTNCTVFVLREWQFVITKVNWHQKLHMKQPRPGLLERYIIHLHTLTGYPFDSTCVVRLLPCQLYLIMTIERQGWDLACCHHYLSVADCLIRSYPYVEHYWYLITVTL